MAMKRLTQEAAQAATRAATIAWRLRKLEKGFWNPPRESREWTELVAAFKEVVETGIAGEAAELRPAIIGLVDAFLYALSNRIRSVDPIFGSITPWIDFVERSFGQLGIAEAESEFIQTLHTMYDRLSR